MYHSIRRSHPALPSASGGGGFIQREREILIDNLLVRVHWIIEMIVEKRPCAMGVCIPDFQVALYLPSQWFLIHDLLACASAGAQLKQGSVALLRTEASLFYRTISGVRLRWELEEAEGPKKARG